MEVYQGVRFTRGSDGSLSVCLSLLETLCTVLVGLELNFELSSVTVFTGRPYDCVELNSLVLVHRSDVTRPTPVSVIAIVNHGKSGFFIQMTITVRSRFGTME